MRNEKSKLFTTNIFSKYSVPIFVWKDELVPVDDKPLGNAFWRKVLELINEREPGRWLRPVNEHEFVLDKVSHEVGGLLGCP